MELLVPEQRLFSVEYPGYVQHEDRVLQTLGGVEGIARQLQDNASVLPLRFRPEDPYSHATYGDKQKANCLLVKLTRRFKKNSVGDAANQPDEAQAGSSAADQARQHRVEEECYFAEVVARVETMYRFTTPADYQYVGLDTRPNATAPLDANQQDPPGFAPQPLLCMPPLFAKAPIFDYAFKGYKSNAPIVEAMGASKRRSGINMISFFSPETPPAPTGTIQVPEEQRPLLDSLQALLQQRPVWVGAALANALPQPYVWSQAKEILPKICYRFRNGPWKHAWVRRGFDPRRTTRARGYQALEYHLPSEWYAKISEHLKAQSAAELASREASGQLPSPSIAAAAAQAVLPPIATSHAQLLRFEAVPGTQSCYLPVRFLQDSKIQGILLDPANHTQHCSDTSGWLTTGAWEAIRKRAKERFQAILDGRPLQLDEDSTLLQLEADEVFEPGDGEITVQHPQQEQQQQEADGLAQQAQQLQLGSWKTEGRKGGKKEEGGGKKEGKKPGRKGVLEGAMGADSAAEPKSPAAAVATATTTAAEAADVERVRDAEDGLGGMVGTGIAPASTGTGAAAERTSAVAASASQQQPAATAAAAAAGQGAAAAAAAGGAGTRGAALLDALPYSGQASEGRVGLLPLGLMASLQDYLAHMPGEDEDEYELLEEDEEGNAADPSAAIATAAGTAFGLEGQGEGYRSEEDGGYQTDELGVPSEDEEED